MRVCLRLFTTAVILLAFSGTVTAQNFYSADTTAPRTSRISLAVTGGYAIPGAKWSLQQFWKGGPALGASFLIRATPVLYFGAGADVSMLWFRSSRFSMAYPSVAVHRTDMAWVNLFLTSRFTFTNNGPVRPYASAAIGASRLSGGEYKEVIDSVRVTYYEIPARTRLALTITGGLAIPVTPGLFLQAEAAIRYVHRDPNVGLGVLFGGGARIIL